MHEFTAVEVLPMWNGEENQIINSLYVGLGMMQLIGDGKVCRLRRFNWF